MRTIASNGGSKPQLPLQETLNECKNKLRSEGFQDIFSLTSRGLYSMNTSRYYRPEQVQLTRCEHIEGNANAAETADIHLIETTDGVKGLLIEHMGAKPDAAIAGFLREAEMIRRQMNGYGPTTC